MRKQEQKIRTQKPGIRNGKILSINGGQSMERGKEKALVGGFSEWSVKQIDFLTLFKLLFYCIIF
jgi:hypothetical protein